MPRGAKATKKPAAKRPTRKAKPVVEVYEPLPELESFLVEMNDWPDVTDILAAKSFKEAMEQFSEVAEFRALLKENLASCYGKKRIPRTPKKLAHKMPPCPIPQTIRVIDFEVDISVEVTGNSDVIAVTGVVPETPTKKLKGPDSHFAVSKNPADVKKTQSPYNSICPMDPVIVSTPSRRSAHTPATVSTPSHKSIRKANTTSTPASNRTVRFCTPLPLHRSTPKPDSTEKKRILQELNQKLEVAGIRHDNFVREQQERVARDNEQRKRRVNQNLQQKQLEQERKQQEIRAQQERVRQFEEAQRSPKTAFKALTPSKVQTPGQKAVPQKRQKSDEQDSQEQIEEQMQSTEAEVQESFPKLRPRKVVEIKVESAYEMTPDKVPQPSTENDYNVIDLSSADETDNEDNPRKQVPRWAEKSALRVHLGNLYKHVSKAAVDAYFGSLKAPKLADLFANSNKDYDSAVYNETAACESP